VAAAIEKHANIADGFGVAGIGGQTSNAGAEAAVNVVLQARTGMIFCEIDKAGRDEETFVNEM
jgi:hypothetical protein